MNLWRLGRRTESNTLVKSPSNTWSVSAECACQRSVIATKTYGQILEQRSLDIQVFSEHDLCNSDGYIPTSYSPVHTAYSTPSNDGRRFLCQLLAVCLRPRSASLNPRLVNGAVFSTAFRLEQLIEITHRWMFESKYDVTVMPWLYLVNFELAFIIALMARHDRGKGAFRRDES